MAKNQSEIMKEIGGYFELELSRINNFPQSDGVLLNSGRNALEFILRSIQNLHKIFIPYYTCDVVLEPINKLGLEYEFYKIDSRLELTETLPLGPGEYILYTNYFGIKDSYIKELAERYGDHLIIDNAQALYAEHIDGINTLYSPRKFVGIPDGGVAFVNSDIDLSIFDVDQSYERFSHLLKRIDSGASSAYSDFKENSHKLVGESIKRMSKLTCKLIESVDFEDVRNVRRANFARLHEALKNSNKLDIPSYELFECPMVYPYWTDDTTLRARLIENKIFVATYWPNVFHWVNESYQEYSLAKNIIPIPIDQRYGGDDMSRIISILKNI